jgi:3-(3-hydroxy-phenyl)propionate hydroxylase
MQRFRHGRLLFVGDAAHQVSPFGARGANSGIQDADNLIWKLALVIDGRAPAALLDSYDAERTAAADENIGHSTRATDFITPKSRVSKLMRNAVLTLAAQFPFARTLVNSGRLSVATVLDGSALNTPDSEDFDGPLQPGAAALDAPLAGGWLLAALPTQFTLLLFADAITPAQQDALDGLARECIPVHTTCVPPEGLAAQRYGARPGTACLLRPDQHLAARWHAFDAAAVRAAVARATAQEEDR